MNNITSIKNLIDIFKKSSLDFGCFYYQEGEFQVSDKSLESLRDTIKNLKNFANHEAVFIGMDSRFPTLFFAFVHNTTRGLSQGGLRFMEYGDDLTAVLNDGLRLSRGMSRKNAVCDLWWGGGKGIIPITAELLEETFAGDLKNQAKRDELFAAYGEFVANLNGIYYTAADIGTFGTDMKAILSKNRFVTCIPPELGGSGDPSPHTAEGVFLAIKTAHRHLSGKTDLTGVSVAVQGAGKVGRYLIKSLTEDGAQVFVSEKAFESSPGFLHDFRQQFPQVEIIASGKGHENDVFGLEVDVIAPCATGGTINEETIKMLKPSVKIVCGGANNILLDEEVDGEFLYQRGIIFIPDFACNWMGIANCANEAFGYLEEDVKKELAKVSPIVEKILQVSSEKNISHTTASNLLADEKINENPPLSLLVNRGQRLLQKTLERN